MLEEDFGITIDLDKVYRMMDNLDDKAIEKLKKITYQNTLNLFGEKIDVIFYDATTIYFESFTPNEHRLPRLYRRGTHLNRLSSVPTCRELALIPTFTDGEFPLN